MRLAALFSGGKDSTYAARIAEEDGHMVPCLVSMRSQNPDSYMFHTVNLHLTELLAQAMDKQHISAPTRGEKEGELEDLKRALRGLDVEGVTTGAIASNYQRRRVDRIAEELGLKHVAPLWGRDRESLLKEMLGKGLKIIVTAVAAHGLDQSWLGRTLDEEAVNDLIELSERYGLDICGEGGEFETLVLDAPWFGERLEVVRARTTWDGVSGRYLIEEARLAPRIA